MRNNVVRSSASLLGHCWNTAGAQVHGASLELGQHQLLGHAHSLHQCPWRSDEFLRAICDLHCFRTTTRSPVWHSLAWAMDLKCLTSIWSISWRLSSRNCSGLAYHTIAATMDMLERISMHATRTLRHAGLA